MVDPKHFVQVSKVFGDTPCPICGVIGGLIGAGMAVDTRLPKDQRKIWTVTYCQGCENHFMTNKPFTQTMSDDVTIINPEKMPEGFEGIEPIINQKFALEFVKRLCKDSSPTDLGDVKTLMSSVETSVGAKPYLGMESQADEPVIPSKKKKRNIDL